jgi:hypothetical protein
MVRQSGLNPEAPARDDCSTQLRSSMHVWLQWRQQRSVKPRPGVVNTGGSSPPTCTSFDTGWESGNPQVSNLRRRFKSGSRNQGSVAQWRVHLIVDQDYAGSNPAGSASFRTRSSKRQGCETLNFARSFGFAQDFACELTLAERLKFNSLARRQLWLTLTYGRWQLFQG